MTPRFSALLAVLLISSQVLRADPGDVTPAQPVIPAHRFNLKDFGAIGDGTTPNLDAIKRAVAAVHAAGGGTLVVPAGTYLTAPFQLCSGINLHLDAGATIQFSGNLADYAAVAPSGGSMNQRTQLTARDCHDVMISGAGAIDGHGGTWWPGARALRDPVTGKQFPGPHPFRPSLLVFRGCQRVRVEGITLQNAPTLNLGIADCQDTTIDGITIQNPPDSPNTDGIDPTGASQRILIAHCRIDTGDDCFSAKNGGAAFQQDTLITDCTFLHGHGCSIGSQTSAIRNFTVRRCTFDGTATGIRLKSSRDRGGLVENLTFEDLTMAHVGHAISLNCNYQGTTTDTEGYGTFPPLPVTAQTPHWRHIRVRNLSATGCTGDAGLILGLPEMPAEDIVLDHVSIDAPLGLRIAYVKDITLHDVQIAAKTGAALTIADTVQGLKR